LPGGRATTLLELVQDERCRTKVKEWHSRSAWKEAIMRRGSRRQYAGLILAAFLVAALAACKTQPSPWSPEVDKLYHQMYGPIIDGG
jgi:hypothetical protein